MLWCFSTEKACTKRICERLNRNVGDKTLFQYLYRVVVVCFLLTARYLISHGKPKSAFGKTRKGFGHRSKILGEGISEKRCIVLLLSLCKLLVS